jgi:hypothetical protein
MAIKNNTARRTFKNTVVAAPIVAPNTQITMTYAELQALLAGSKSPASKSATKVKASVPAPVVTLPTSKPVSAAPANKSDGPSRSGTYLAHFDSKSHPAVRSAMKTAHFAGRAAGKGKAYTVAYNASLASVGLPAYY